MNRFNSPPRSSDKRVVNQKVSGRLAKTAAIALFLASCQNKTSPTVSTEAAATTATIVPATAGQATPPRVASAAEQKPVTPAEQQPAPVAPIQPRPTTDISRPTPNAPHIGENVGMNGYWGCAQPKPGTITVESVCQIVFYDEKTGLFYDLDNSKLPKNTTSGDPLSPDYLHEELHVEGIMQAYPKPDTEWNFAGTILETSEQVIGVHSNTAIDPPDNGSPHVEPL